MPSVTAGFSITCQYTCVTNVVGVSEQTNDAALIETALKNAGFEVMRRDSLDQQGMRLALVEFSRKLKQGAETGIFYCAGHGVEIDGKNCLVPVDSNMQSKEEADVFNFDVNSFLAMMENSGCPSTSWCWMPAATIHSGYYAPQVAGWHRCAHPLADTSPMPLRRDRLQPTAKVPTAPFTPAPFSPHLSPHSWSARHKPSAHSSRCACASRRV